jgi:hypothetical protein
MPMWKRFDHLGLIHHENAQHRLYTDAGRALPSRQRFSGLELVLRLAFSCQIHPAPVKPAVELSAKRR